MFETADGQVFEIPEADELVDRDRIGEILERLERVEGKVDDIVARGKKTNSLVGMLVGRGKAAK